MKSIIRNFIAKLVAGRSDDGIMITLKDPKKVDFQTAMMEDLLMRNGIDPRAIKSEQQLKNILNQIDAASKQTTQTGIRNTESAKVFDLEGKEIPKGSKIMGGKAVNDDLPPPGSRGGKDDIAAPVQSEDEIMRRLDKENKEARRNLQIKLSKDKGYQKFKGETEEEIRKRFKLDDPEEKAYGGRIGLKDGMDRRKFMKIMGGLATLPVIGKFAKGVKLAAPAVTKAAELTGPALAKIVETVMDFGKLVSVKGRRVKEMVTKKKYKDIEVEEDVGDGSYIIKKGDKEIYYKPGRQDETGGFDDDIIEILEDRIKKAGGGLSYMLGE
jgi:hypothetical protein